MNSKQKATAIIAAFIAVGLFVGLKSRAEINSSSAVKVVCFPGKSGDMGLGQRIAQRYQALGLPVPAVRNLGSTQMPTVGKKGVQGVRGSCVAIYPAKTFIVPPTQEIQKLRSSNISVFSSVSHGGKMFVPKPNVPQTKTDLMSSLQVEFHISNNAVSAMKEMGMLPKIILQEEPFKTGQPARFNPSILK